MVEFNRNCGKGTKITKPALHSFLPRIILFFSLAHFGHHLLTSLIIPLLPTIRDEFSLNYTQVGWVLSVFTIAYSLGQLPAGWLADRSGRRIMITVGICGVAVFGILIGLSQTYSMLLVFLMLMGLAGSGYHPSAMPMVTECVETNYQGRALGIHQIGSSTSFFLTPLIAAAIINLWGWRSSFITLAVPTMVYGLLFYIILGRYKKPNRTQPTTKLDNHKTITSPINSRRLVAIMVLSALTHIITILVIGFIPLFLVDKFGISEGTSAIFLSIIHSAGLWAALLGGYLCDRFGTVSILLVVCLIGSPVIYLLNLAPYGLATALLLLIIGAVTYIRLTASTVCIIQGTPERHRSKIFGIYFTIVEAGSALAPLVGLFIDNWGFSFTFASASIFLVTVTTVSLLFLWFNLDNRRKHSI